MPKISGIVLISFLISCAVSLDESQWEETGSASFYHPNLHGNHTASGEKYDQNELTAAHKSLAFGTLVKVTNLKNQKSVVVRINDRGPFGRNRIIDLSMAAAKKLEMIRDGIVGVKLEVLDQ